MPGLRSTSGTACTAGFVQGPNSNPSSGSIDNTTLLNWNGRFTQLRGVTIFLLVLCFMAVLTVCPWAGAQQKIDDAGVRIFKGQSGNRVVVGTLLQVERTRATILDRTGQRADYPIDEFSPEDQQWILRKSAESKKFEKQRKDINNIVRDMNSMRPSTILQASKRLRSYGSAATYVAPMLREYWKSDDPKVRRETFVTYVYICRKTDSELSSILNELQTQFPDIADAISEDPASFMTGVALFEDRGLDYLTAVAFQCQLFPDDKRSTPVELEATFGSEANLRRSACEAIGRIHHQGSAKALLDLLEVAENPDEGGRDDATIKVILAALGRTGIKNAEVEEMLGKFKSEFPDIVSKAVEQLNSRAASDAAMPEKLFRDQNGQPLVRGTLLSIDGDMVLILNSRQEQAIYKLEQFSEDDQKWIAAQSNSANSSGDEKDKTQPGGLPGIDR